MPYFHALILGSLLITPLALAQDPSVPPEKPAAVPATPVVRDNRAFGVLANYRTAELDEPFVRISVKEKFVIARKDSLDWPAYILAGFFSGVSQLDNSNPSFGQGLKGFGHRYICSVADQDMGNFLTEAILPSMFHQDPRYFRKGHGSVMGRVGYAISRAAIARNDSGHWTFNAAEFLGNGIVASVGNAYYPDQVGFSPTMQRMFTQIGTDAVSQVLKEFWPDIKRKMAHRKAQPDVAGLPSKL